MAKLTLVLDDDLLRRARMRASERNTTVEALIRDYLAGLGAETATRQALAEFLDLADQVSSAPNGHDRSRENLRELLDRHIEERGAFSVDEASEAREMLYGPESRQRREP